MQQSESDRREKRYISLDDLNDALLIGAERERDNRSLQNIPTGLQVTSRAINALMNYRSWISEEEARNLLVSWANYLQQHHEFISPHKFNRSMFDFLAKNSPAPSLMLDERLNMLCRGAEDVYQIIAKEFAKGWGKGFYAISVFERSADAAKMAVAYAYLRAFLRKVSKLALNWAFDPSSPVSGVDFLTFFEGKNFEGEALERRRHFGGHSIGEVGDFAYPITFSELQHARRKRHPIWNIQSLPNYRSN
ncbi:hypothetical protein [Burkholderia cenocepacia]|uniref:hypothetical protein n=1 Tax=Burkholderia cenocepacia TaxID=95486 RepID=UPI000F5B73B2|nr:hypothetical protein [Burkholderia cenocepacia]